MYFIFRIRTEIGGGAWCPKQQITTEPREWLEVNLHSVRVITAVETQGRFGNGQGQEYAEAYLLEYYRPRLAKWVRYRNNKGEEVSHFAWEIRVVYDFMAKLKNCIVRNSSMPIVA